MRSLTIAVVFVLLVLCPFATSGKPVGGKEKKALSTFEKYAKLTSKVKVIRFEMTLKFVSEKDGTESGKLSFVGDKEKGRYAFKMETTKAKGGNIATQVQGLVHTNSETVGWRRIDGDLKSLWKSKQPKKAKLPAYVDDLKPLCFVYDGLYGYKLLEKEITLKPENPPGHKKDGLTWYLASAVKHKKRSEFQEKMSLDQASVWLGFSPKDGWIHGLVFMEGKEGAGGDLGVLKITKLDLNPKLKGAFDLPADVKAELDEMKEKNG